MPLHRGKNRAAISSFLEPFASRTCLIGSDEALVKRDLFEARNLDTLPVLDRPDELRRLEEAVVRASVEPRIASAHLFDEQVARFHVQAVEIGDLKLAAGGGLQVARELDDAVVVEIQAGNRMVRLGLCGLFLEADRLAAFAELNHAVALGIVDAVGEHRRAAHACDRARQQIGQMRAKEDVVAEHERDIVVADEVSTDRERLGEALGPGLFCVGDRQAECGPILEQATVIVDIFGARDD